MYINNKLQEAVRTINEALKTKDIYIWVTTDNQGTKMMLNENNELQFAQIIFKEEN